MKIPNSLVRHLLPIVGALLLISIFFMPLYSGKTLIQSDNVQITGVNKEVSEFRDKGEQIHWNNREFSGVPLLMSSDYNPFKYINQALFYSIFPKPVMMIFALFIGFYILLLVFGVSHWLAAVGAIAYAFSTFNIISVEVGHDNKVIAIALMAPILAGIILSYRGSYFKGALLTLFSAGLQLYYAHIQISYYLLLMVIGYLVVVIYRTIKTSNWQLFIRASLSLLAATIVAVGCNFTKIYATYEYSDYSTRGGSDLTQNAGENVSKEGLDKDYALSWSNGVLETFTVMFPYFHGGASGESLDESSTTYKVLSSKGADRNTIARVTANIPLYWGDQPFTAGPIYFGSIVCFFFILGLIFLKGPLKWWALVFTILSFLLAMGKNLEWFTDLFFYNVPLYNKFRSVTMIMSMAQLLVPFIGMLTLHKILTKRDEIDLKKIFYAAGGVIVVGLFFIIFKGGFFDFTGSRDSAYGFPDWLLAAIREDRKSLFNTSIIRSLVFIILAVVVIWLYVKNTIKLSWVITSFAVLILIDLWVVNKRYLGEEDFDTKSRYSQQVFQPSNASQRINQDDGYFRVLNLSSQNPFSDGITSYHHYSLLGYSAIKMQRYQEVIDAYISSMDVEVLSMLNTRYVIQKGAQGNPVAQMNRNALGNAWLVNELELVDNADQEYTKLGEIDPGKTAIVDKSRFEDVSGASYSGSGSIELASYHPEKMEYDFSSDETQFAVFSEIYFQPGWNAYVDGSPADYIRVNYILRGMEVPAGQHQITFKYEPVSISWGTPIIYISTFLMLMATGFVTYISFAKKD